MHEDNQSCINIIHGEKFSNRTKHIIDTKYHIVKDCVEIGIIQCIYCPTEMVADLLTKPLKAVRIKQSKKLCGLSSENEKEC